jgi:hypothetical protein
MREVTMRNKKITQQTQIIQNGGVIQDGGQIRFFLDLPHFSIKIAGILLNRFKKKKSFKFLAKNRK